MLGLVVELQPKRKRAGAKGVQNAPRSLPSRLDPGTYSISLHFYFAPLLLAFPTGDGPGFVTFERQQTVMMVTMASGLAGAQRHHYHPREEG